jgi:hypothetical protein
MTAFVTRLTEVTSQIECHLGPTTIHKGDRVGLQWRGDGLFDVYLDGQRINWAIDAEYVNRLAGKDKVAS